METLYVLVKLDGDPERDARVRRKGAPVPSPKVSCFTLKKMAMKVVGVNDVLIKYVDGRPVSVDFLELTNPYHVRYVGRFIPKSVREGRILVHNHVRHTPTMQPRVNGFRAWTEDEGVLKEGKRVLCDCGWSGLTHYKVKPGE
jgi:hypothetical protein